MNNFKSAKEGLFNITKETFEAHALSLFKLQSKYNPLYKQYIDCLNIKPSAVNSLDKIPFLPIDFFKTQVVKTSTWEPVAVFESSGTTAQVRSKHYVEDISYYYHITESIFKQFYGRLEDYHIMALLPSYLERENSSLVAMVDHFIKKSNSPYSGFYLYDLEDLVNQIKLTKNKGKTVLLIGVSFALLDLAEQFDIDLENGVVMETGGMKGRREELTREELHAVLCNRLHIKQVHSEYGMTELLSQAYAKGKGHFVTPPWMNVLIRDINDPFDVRNSQGAKKTGGINIIDLANIQSCAFIETQDIGRKITDNTFEVLGRFDNADIRGCNLLVV